MIMIEQHQEQMKSKQAIFTHQMEDSKRRQLELEDKQAHAKHLIEQLKLQAEAPTSDKANVVGAKQDADSEEVL